MGSLFLAAWVGGHFGTLAQAQEKPAPTILPPGRPATKPANAPRPDDESDPFSSILERRRQRLDKANAVDAAARNEPISVARQIEKLKKERGDGSPSRSFVALTPIFAKVTTSGSDRKNYGADITTLFHWATRVDSSKSSDKTQLFAGFRLAPFTGTGIHQGVPGRYGFTYFGPMIGLGKIRPPGDDASDDKAQLAAEEKPEFASGFRSGVLWTAGLALTSRMADTGSMRPKGEFENKSVLLDGTGIWTELTYEALFYETIALRGLAGLQTGKDKLFFYGGVGFGLWM